VDAGAPSLEALLQEFTTRRGLYVLGAGASAGVAPFGWEFMIRPALNYVRGPSFPGEIPCHSELNRRIIHEARDIPMSWFFPGREIRSGTAEPPYRELLARLPNFFARLFMKHDLSCARNTRRHVDNYRVFNFFHSSTILNYNLDGLAGDICGRSHHVVDVHGTIERAYGSPHMQENLLGLRDFDLPLQPDGLLLCVPESSGDLNIRRLEYQVWKAARSSPKFIALIGYSFGRNRQGYDDHESLDLFRQEFRGFRGAIYVIDPQPDASRHICDMIAELLQSSRVCGVRRYWNVLAHAFVEALCHPYDQRSLDRRYGEVLDSSGGHVAFPTALGPPA